MKKGLIFGDFTVLSNSQIKYIREWQNHNDIQDIFFRLQPSENASVASKRKLLNCYLRGRDHEHYECNEYEYSAKLEIKQDVAITKGDFSDYSIEIRGLLIAENIYRIPIAHALLKPKRIIHVDSMTKLAMQLAKVHGVDVDKANIAGLFHDCTKRWDLEESLPWMRLYAPDAINRAPATYHQYTGSAYLKNQLGYTDEDVLKAILHHVDGDDESPLSLIIYIADKLDPSRQYDSSSNIELAMHSLTEGARKVREEQIRFLKEEGKTI